MGILSDTKKPFNILMLSIAIISIVLATYFFFQSRRIQRPTYLISDEISKVYDSSKKAPNLGFLKASGERIEKDVFLITVHFWNSGNLSIEPQDIRKPVEFTISNCEEIVDYDVVAQTNPDITHFFLSRANDQRTLVLNWKHLDPNNGVKFQVFYTGSAHPEPLFTGNILGRTTFLYGGTGWSTRLFGLYGALASLFGVMIVGAVVIGTYVSRIRDSQWRVSIGLLVAISFGFLLAWIFLLLGRLTPPV